MNYAMSNMKLFLLQIFIYIFNSNQMIKLKVHCSTPIACNIGFKILNFMICFYFKHGIVGLSLIIA